MLQRSNNNANLANSGSRTVVEEQNDSHVTGHLELRGTEENTRARRHVAWAEDTVDNELMNKKKSKICCIFTPNSGDYEEEISSDSGSESGSSDSDSDSVEDCGHCHDHGEMHASKNHKNHRGKEKIEPNAYEIQPKYKSVE